MANIKAIDFAKNVNINRQRLVQHCIDNGIAANEGESLDAIVQKNNTIESGQSGFKVTYKDLDGTVLKTEYVANGGAATPPANPTFDSDYLEFDSWVVSGNSTLSAIVEETLIMPQYKTKLDSTLNERPTYLFCYFGGNTSSLSPTLYFKQHSSTYIDWGDGSTAESISSDTIAHTYANEGYYVIKVYGTLYRIGGKSNYGLFNSTGYQYALLKAYMGENQNGLAYGEVLRQSYSLRTVVLPKTATLISSDAFNACYSLDNVVIPSGLTSLDNSSIFNNCYALQNIVIPKSVTQIGQGTFTSTFNLNKIFLPNATFGSSVFSSSGIRKINLPNDLITLQNQLFMNSKIQNIILPNTLTTIGIQCFSGARLESIIIPDSVTSIGANAFISCDVLKNIVLYNDFDVSGLLTSTSPLSKECLIDIAKKLKDRTGENANTITFGERYCKTIMNAVCLDASGNEVAYGTVGAKSLLQFMTDKNWTVSFTS